MSTITERTNNYKNYEKIKEVKARIITMPCRKCDGEMEFTGESYLTSPMFNVHKCNKCGCEEEFLGVIYPRAEWKEGEDVTNSIIYRDFMKRGKD